MKKIDDKIEDHDLIYMFNKLDETGDNRISAKELEAMLMGRAGLMKR